MSDLLRITDDTTAEDLAEYLTNPGAFAKRQQRIVGSEDYPSSWDKAHRRMDGPLDDVLRARRQSSTSEPHGLS